MLSNCFLFMWSASYTRPTRARAALIWLGLLTASGPAGSETVASLDINLTATITASCTVSLDKTAIDLGSISSTALAAMTKNQRIGTIPAARLTEMSKCAGTSNAILTVSTTAATADGYLVPEGDVIRFEIDWVYSGKQKAFDDATKSFTIPVTKDLDDPEGHMNRFDIYAVAGTNANNAASAGTYSSIINFQLSPD